jgi:hypothetical protein
VKPTRSTACRRAGRLPHQLLCALRAREDRRRLLQEELAIRGQLHPAPVALQQARAQLGLELGELAAQRRLAQVDPARGAVEAQLFRQRDERA